MDSPLAPLRGSVGRLHELTRGLDDAQLQAPSYCSEWSIADVLSHLGSGAVDHAPHPRGRAGGPHDPRRLRPVGVGRVEQEVGSGQGGRRAR